MTLRLPLIAVLAASAVLCLACDEASEQSARVAPSPPGCASPAAEGCWKQIEPAGRAVFASEWQEGKWPQALMPVVAWGGKLWMVDESHAFSSADGLAYTRHDKTRWAARLSPNYAFFRDEIWLVGGMELSSAGYPEGTFTSVVWSTRDGLVWRVHGAAAFPPRKSTALIVYKERLWLFGGANSIEDDGANDAVLNDVWSSADGVEWSLVTAEAPWAPRADAGIEVFDGELYLVGGAGHNDVWRSVDGAQWTLVTREPEWNVRNDHGTAAFDGKLWVFGGYVGDHRNAQNDVWYSTDGKRWTRQGERAPWSPRSAVHHAVFHDQLWIFSGKHTSARPNWPGDIWTMTAAKR